METLSYRSTHSYDRAAIGIEIPIRLSFGEQEVRLTAKLDTGASFCIFQRDYAEHLGIEVESGLPTRIATPAGGVFLAYGHILRLSCLEWEIETTVYFAESLSFNRNVLGRDGWLQHFRIGVVHANAMLYLSHNDD
jgi:hypothetical protein